MAECMTPFTVTVKSLTNPHVQVPCGACPACVSRRVSGWSFRLQYENKVASDSSFITLTYDTKYVPITRNGYMSCNKRDVQLFFKRLRKYNRDTRVKYYAVSEYGGQTQRPHYHIILFNAKVETVQNAWTLGNIHYGDVTGASIGYCLKYISKKKLISSLGDDDDRRCEFNLISKGIGASYLTKEMVDWHFADVLNRMYVNLPGGKKASMPRYYKDKLYSEIIRKLIAASSKEKISAKLEKEMRVNPNYHFDKAMRTLGAFKKMRYHAEKIDCL